MRHEKREGLCGKDRGRRENNASLAPFASSLAPFAFAFYQVPHSMCPVIHGQQSMETLRWIASIVVPAFFGLVGVAIGAWLTSQREQRQLQLTFLEKQLNSFYSPMLGLRNEIRAHSAFRVRVQKEAREAWALLCAETEELNAIQRQGITNERGPEFMRIIEYDNTKLNEELLPLYGQKGPGSNYSAKMGHTPPHLPAHRIPRFGKIWAQGTTADLSKEIFKVYVSGMMQHPNNHQTTPLRLIEKK